MLSKIVRELAFYLIAGTIALSGAGCKERYEVRKVGENKGKSGNVVGESDEVSLEKTLENGATDEKTKSPEEKLDSNKVSLCGKVIEFPESDYLRSILEQKNKDSIDSLWSEKTDFFGAEKIKFKDGLLAVYETTSGSTSIFFDFSENKLFEVYLRYAEKKDFDFSKEFSVFGAPQQTETERLWSCGNTGIRLAVTDDKQHLTFYHKPLSEEYFSKKKKRRKVLTSGSICEQIKRNKLEYGTEVYADVHESPGYERIIFTAINMNRCELSVYSYSGDLLKKENRVPFFNPTFTLVDIVNDKRLEFLEYVAGYELSLYKFYGSDLKKIWASDKFPTLKDFPDIFDTVNFSWDSDKNHKITFDNGSSPMTVYGYNKALREFVKTGSKKRHTKSQQGCL